MMGLNFEIKFGTFGCQFFDAYWYILSFNLFAAFAPRWNLFVSDMLHCLPGRHKQTTP